MGQSARVGTLIRRGKVKIPESQKKDGKEAREGHPALARL